MALEHCIAPFLNKCDADDDHLITLKEWARCLELNEVSESGRGFINDLGSKTLCKVVSEVGSLSSVSLLFSHV